MTPEAEAPQTEGPALQWCARGGPFVMPHMRRTRTPYTQTRSIACHHQANEAHVGRPARQAFAVQPHLCHG